MLLRQLVNSKLAAGQDFTAKLLDALGSEEPPDFRAIATLHATFQKIEKEEMSASLIQRDFRGHQARAVPWTVRPRPLAPPSPPLRHHAPPPPLRTLIPPPARPRFRSFKRPRPTC